MIRAAVLASNIAPKEGLKALLEEEGVRIVELSLDTEKARASAEPAVTVDVIVFAGTDPQDLNGYLQRSTREAAAPPAFLFILSDGDKPDIPDEWNSFTWGVLPQDFTRDELGSAVAALASGLMAGPPGGRWRSSRCSPAAS